MNWEASREIVRRGTLYAIKRGASLEELYRAVLADDLVWIWSSTKPHFAPITDERARELYGEASGTLFRFEKAQ